MEAELTLLKTALERMISSELNVHLRQSKLASLGQLNEPDIKGSDDPSKPRNRRNGSSSKTVRADTGKRQLDIPRDRAGTFMPQLVKKHDRQLAGFDEKILAMYAKGMTTRDIIRFGRSSTWMGSLFMFAMNKVEFASRRCMLHWVSICLEKRAFGFVD